MKWYEAIITDTSRVLFCFLFAWVFQLSWNYAVLHMFPKYVELGYVAAKLDYWASLIFISWVMYISKRFEIKEDK